MMVIPELKDLMKIVEDRLGDYLFDPEPQHERDLEGVERHEIREAYRHLRNIRVLRENER